jgi:hypothetical protein
VCRVCEVWVWVWGFVRIKSETNALYFPIDIYRPRFFRGAPKIFFETDVYLADGH